ncbi:MAG: glycine-rich domain-containing protein [Thainema sp.]
MTTEKLQTEQDTANLPNMTAQQVELYERIQAFTLEQPDAQLPFSQRLARDNGWSLEYAQQVIEEYKKFTFLAVAADHPVTPSDQVDQAWHLHLSYTRSYWEEFCPQVLQTPLHHGPTLGGQAENEKFDDWYRQTLTSYAAFFNQAPPSDIWPAPEVRFGRDLHFVRVNTQQNWVIAKFLTQQKAMIGMAVLTVISLGYVFTGALLVFRAKYIHFTTATPYRESVPRDFNSGLLACVLGIALYGGIYFLKQVLDFIEKPSRPTVLGSVDSNYGGGYGSSLDWGNFGGDAGGGDCGGDGDGCGGCGCGCGGCGGGCGGGD